MTFISRLRPWVLPISMIGGVVFHSIMEYMAFVAPYLIFIMLLVTFCKLDFSRMRITRSLWLLLACQLVGAIVVYFLLKPFNEIVAQGVFICIFCPTATAAPVVTSMLGGSLMKLVTFSLMSNVAVALCAPFMFTEMSDGHISFVAECLEIARRVIPMLLIPLAVAVILRKIAPRVHSVISGHQSISFYIWAVSLFIVVGRAVSFVLSEPSDMIPTMIVLGVTSLAACVAQFAIGRGIGRRYGDKVSGAQGLGQKNTVLAIWMALTYLNPISSVAPAAYVAWQNTINSVQLYLHAKQRTTRTR